MAVTTVRRSYFTTHVLFIADFYICYPGTFYFLLFGLSNTGDKMLPICYRFGRRSYCGLYRSYTFPFNYARIPTTVVGVQRYSSNNEPPSSPASPPPLSQAVREQAVIEKLKEVRLPKINRALGDVGCLQGLKVNVATGKVTVSVDFLVPGYPHKDTVVSAIERAVSALSWVKEVTIHDLLDVKRRREEDSEVQGLSSSLSSSSGSSSSNTNGLSGVSHVIGVSSCKGGVGKSTVAANLAVSLAKKGLRIGILDADLYGPSLPHLLQPADTVVRKSKRNPSNIVPLRSVDGDIAMMSFGFVNAKSGAPGAGGQRAAVMRGAMATKVTAQLLLNTDWGYLDYLIIDMPPGTGDVQLTLCQNAAISGAVVVTTPHPLSLVDAAKGVAMFAELKIPTLGLVENMSHFTADDGKKYFPFGKGGRRNLLKGFSIIGSSGSNNSNSSSSSSNKDIENNSSNSKRSSSGISSNSSMRAQKDMDAAVERLRTCPLLRFPLSDDNSCISSSSSSSSGISGISSDDKDDEEEEDLDGEVYESSSAGDAPLKLVSVRLPKSESALLYAQLADTVIDELFDIQMNVFTVPTVRYVANKQALLLRYFTTSSAIEYVVPIAELYRRDPSTGEVVTKGRFGGDIDDNNNCSSSSSNNNTDAQMISNVIVEVKGAYGVSIVWDNVLTGEKHSDIFTFDALKRIHDGE